MSKVLVMLSIFNGEKYLNKQLESIYEQKTEHTIKLLVRDDGSTDSSLDIINGWRNKLDIEIIYDGKNLGPARSFMELFSHAEDADYYAFVDQDDKWDECKIQNATRMIGNTNEKVLWFSNCRLIDSNDRIIDNTLHKKKPELNMISQLICGSAQGCAMVFNKPLFNFINNLNNINYFMHDQLVMEYALACGKVIYDETSYFSYRVHSNNVIAKDGKTFYSKIKNTLQIWFGKKYRFKISSFAQELLDNVGYLMDEHVKEYFEQLSNCRNSIISRLYIIRSNLTRSSVVKATRSFKIKVILGII